ncbi:hypothetical protein PM082_020346 [Marasmius tenuissimus]|nr:hypothetical protein PM082_020346 [Marasmius tenuissimus]
MPSHLEGLNLLHPAQPEETTDNLLAGAHFPDITAQLALWNSLPFDTDDGSSLNQEDQSHIRPNSKAREGKQTGATPSAQGSPFNAGVGSTEQTVPQFDWAQALDLNTLMSTFQQQQSHLQPPPLAQLLALQSLAQSPGLTAYQQHGPQPQSPALHSQPATPPGASDISPPPAKRQARSRKSSSATSEANSPNADLTSINGEEAAVAAAEDKRRRNTAASARFRMKKKEREFALETKAKELEMRVNDLEKECEGLRRENGWLKGLVVGVTGAAQQQNPQTPPVGQAGQKRHREDSSN